MKMSRGDFMNIKKILKLRLIINLIILILLILLGIYLDLNLNKNVSNVLEYKKINTSSNTSNNGITFEDLNKLKKQYTKLIFTGYKEVISNIQNKYGNSPSKAIKTKIVLIDENYLNLYPYKILAGGKFNSLSIKNGEKVAVISDVMAADLFKSIKVIGDTITLNNEKYRIVGVYKENQSLTYEESEDGYERVYIPYSSYTIVDKTQNLFLDVFTTKETTQMSYKNINNDLTKTLGQNFSSYKMVNYTILKNMVFQYMKILCFLIGICVIIFIIKIILQYLKNIVVFFREKFQTNYFKDILINYKKELIISFSKVVLLLISIIMIFNLIKFNVVIEDKYLPTDNIFDVPYYTKTILDDIKLSNAGEQGFNNVYNEYVSNINNIEKLIFFTEIVTCSIFIINGRLLIILTKPQNQ
jgi:putative ABC transport system permease protein